jgi:predicted dehydrogenase
MHARLKVGICGAGQFAQCFIPLFKAHPSVGEVALAEVVPERLAKQADRFKIRRRFSSFDELCRSDVDAVAILTQRWMHAPMALQALRSGKHVYSAVPTGIALDEIGALVEEVKRSGLTYMLGETSYYYGSTLLCRERFRKGLMGRFVYGEAEYLHDMEHGFYAAYQYSGGADWKRTASFPPMWYPTHTVSMVASVTGARMTHVSCLGQVDRSDDGVFREDVSLWKNSFSNQTALFRTSDGGMARVNEFRRVGQRGGRSVRCSIFGTEAAYEEKSNGAIWTSKGAPPEDVEPLIRCEARREEVGGDVHDALKAEFGSACSKVHPHERLPREFARLPNGHEGSHQFLVDDFVRACATGKLPPNHVWAAARYSIPGLIAHESSLREGEMLRIPDLGDPPAGRALLFG